MRKKISQNEAIRLRHQVKALQREVSDLEMTIWRWRQWSDLPSATEIFRLTDTPLALQWAVYTAQQLKHTVISRSTGKDLVFYALPSPKEK